MLKEYTQPTVRNATIFVALALMIGGLGGMLASRLNDPLYVFVALIGLAAFIITIASVEFGLLFFVLITYTRFSDVAIEYHGAPSVAKSFFVLILVAILVRWAVFSEKPENWQRPVVLVAAVGLVGLASALYARNTSLVFGTLDDFYKDALIAVIVAMLIKNVITLRRVVWTLLLAGIFMGAIVTFQYLTKTFSNEYWGFAQTGFMHIAGDLEGFRIAGPVGDPNFFAQTMVVLIPLALERMLHEKKRSMQVLAGVALVLSSLAVVFTFSRGGFLAAAAAVGLLLIMYPPKFNYMPLFMAAVVVVLVLIPPSYYQRILSLEEMFSATSVDFRTEDRAFRGRASELLSGIEMIRDHPFFGIGLGNYAYLYNTYSRQIGLAPSAGARDAHNLYLEALTETGVVGFAVFMTMIVVSVRSVFQARRSFLKAGMQQHAHLVNGFLLAFIAYLVGAIFVHDAYPRYFYLLIGIALSMPLVVKNTLAKQNLNQPV